MGTRNWNAKEFQKLLSFCKKNKEYLLNKVAESVKQNKIAYKNNFFLNMSLFVKTRSSKKCKEKYHRQEKKILRMINIPETLLEQYNRIIPRKIGGGISKKIKKKEKPELFSLKGIVVPSVLDSRIKNPSNHSHSKLFKVLDILSVKD